MTIETPTRAGAPPTSSAAQHLQIEFTFELPLGYVDSTGTVHRSGTMRRATARDELAPLADLRVRDNEAYLGVVLLSLVVTQLGSLPEVNPNIMESLFAVDLAYLQDLYEQINDVNPKPLACPSCGTEVPGRETRGRLGES
ncbi:hypothetical protein [Streptomyces sp. WZ-12]|uniref:hypothetical protein n=1 Tax=Streptomyces sp. WZ-12 TaxID=3030210 RepID=UPI0023813335|nr:hypothetical protein [Streptomyces sp. WZ-12]